MEGILISQRKHSEVFLLFKLIHRLFYIHFDDITHIFVKRDFCWWWLCVFAIPVIQVQMSFENQYGAGHECGVANVIPRSKKLCSVQQVFTLLVN